MVVEIISAKSTVEITGTMLGVGAQSDSSSIGIAGEAVNQFRIVALRSDGKLYKISNTEPSIVGIVGLTLNGGLTDSQISYTSKKEIKDSFFDTFQEGVVFLGLDGELTQTTPTTGWLFIVGSVVTPGIFKLAINIATAIERN